MRARGQAFNKEFMENQFREVHKVYMGSDAETPLLGYPDTGAGTYARALPYKDWFYYNCAQRVHANSIEHLSWVMPLMLVNGLFLPRFTATMGCVVLVGRELYRYGYMTKHGPNSGIRELGALPLNAAEILILGSLLFVYARYKFGPFVSRRKIV